MIYKILLLLFTVSICYSKEKTNLIVQKSTPTIYLSKDEINDLGEMKVGDLLFLIEHNIPISPRSKKYKNILKKVKKSKNTHVILSEDMIIVEIFSKDQKTGERIKVMDVYYIFSNKKLIKGPVVKRNGAIKFEYKNK